jgi:alpha-methylacyl-CoA racemase
MNVKEGAVGESERERVPSGSGALAGLTVIEVAGIGPGPFAGMMLADMGARVIRVDRLGDKGAFVNRPEADVLARGRESVTLNLKDPQGLALLLELVDGADALYEGYRPGVAERLGFGPEVCLARNERLVYGRMTGYGQEGPLASAAGHDVNYLSVAGALYHMGRSDERPVPPLNLVGDFGGGGMLLAFGLVCALLEAARSGKGQVVDAAMIDGVTALMAMIWSARAEGMWTDARGSNSLDSGAPFYDVYETADGEFISIGAMEPQFFAQLLERLGLTGEDCFAVQRDRALWPEAKRRLEDLFRTRTRSEWVAVFDGADACFTPVFSMAEVTTHPHHLARSTFVTIDGVVQGAAAPRLSRTPGQVGLPPRRVGQHTDHILDELGYDAVQVGKWRADGVVG